MPYYELSEESFNSLPEEVKQKAKVYEPEDVTGLKNKANQLLTEKKAVESDLLKAQADLKAAKATAGSEGGSDLELKLKDALDKLDAKDRELTDYKSEIQSQTLNREADQLAFSLTKDKDRARLLSQQFRSRITLENDGLSVLDENGKPTISTIDDLVGQMKTSYPFLVDGSAASGGGSSGGSGGAGKTKKFSELNGAERTELFRTDPAEYNRLKAAES